MKKQKYSVYFDERTKNQIMKIIELESCDFQSAIRLAICAGAKYLTEEAVK